MLHGILVEIAKDEVKALVFAADRQLIQFRVDVDSDTVPCGTLGHNVPKDRADIRQRLVHAVRHGFEFGE